MSAVPPKADIERQPISARLGSLILR